MKLGALKLKDKILILILPVIIISITIATFLSYRMSKQILVNEYKNQKYSGISQRRRKSRRG